MYFKPSYVPYNDAAKDSVKTLAEDLGLPSDIKHQIVLASFLAVAKKAKGKPFDWWTGNDDTKLKFWSLYEHVSNQSIRRVYKLLKEHGYIGYIIGFTPDEVEAMGVGKPNWVTAQRLPEDLLNNAIFIEANLPPVLVNKKETYEEKL